MALSGSPLSLENFEIGVTLIAGSFGRLKYATHKEDGEPWSIKITKKAEAIRLGQVDYVISEKTILSNLDHPFIIKFAGTFQDACYLYMVLECVMGGDFLAQLQCAQRFDNNQAKFYAAQVVLIFEYLHSQDIIYRDLKPENLLLDRRGYLKLIDFRCAKRVAFKTFTLCGTEDYMAPEELLSKGHGKGVDWWAMGIFNYEMIAGQTPFAADDPVEICKKIIIGKPVFPRFIDPQAKSLIKKLLTVDLTRRCGCLRRGSADVKQHKWFRGFSWELLTPREISAPIIPRMKSDDDTSNFDSYPDSMEEPVEIDEPKLFAEF